MCTIGWVRHEGRTFTFKQCDLTAPTQFFEPEVVPGRAGRYLAFRRKGRPGIWSGVNERGVSFVAADYYTNSDPGEPTEALPSNASAKALVSNQASIHAVRFGPTLLLRHVDFDDRHLILRPYAHNFPVQLLPLGPEESPGDYIVGRVCMVMAEV